MLFFRRPLPPTILEPNLPPPSSHARAEKERSWLQSISSKTKGLNNKLVSKVVPSSREREKTSEKALGDGLRVGRTASVRSGSNRRSWFGMGKGPGENEELSVDSGLDRGIAGAPRTLVKSSSRVSLLLWNRKSMLFEDEAVIVPRPSPSYASSAPTAAPRRSHVLPPPLPIESPENSSTDESTKTLASRLRELAVANSDGLLDDGQYRILRGQLFDQYTKSSTGREMGVGALLGKGSEAVPRSDGTTITKSTTEPSLSSISPIPDVGLVRGRSILSSKSRTDTMGLTSLFRRGTGSSRHVLEDADGRRRREASVQSSHSTISENDLPSRTRSIRHHPGLSTTSGYRDSYVEGGSIATTSWGRNSMASRESLVGQRNSLSYPASSRPNGSSRRPTLGSINYSSSEPPPNISHSTDPFAFIGVEKEPTSSELRQEIEDIDSEWSRMTTSWNDMELEAKRKAAEVGGGRPLIKGRRNGAIGSSPPLPPTPEFTTIGVGVSDEVIRLREDSRRRVEEIGRGKMATDSKYNERLDYLRARLDGAVIREGLPR